MPLKSFYAPPALARFDEQSTRAERQAEDKLAVLRELWATRSSLLPTMYVSGPEVTMDEHLHDQAVGGLQRQVQYAGGGSSSRSRRSNNSSGTGSASGSGEDGLTLAGTVCKKKPKSPGQGPGHTFHGLLLHAPRRAHLLRAKEGQEHATAQHAAPRGHRRGTRSLWSCSTITPTREATTTLLLNAYSCGRGPVSQHPQRVRLQRLRALVGGQPRVDVTHQAKEEAVPRAARQGAGCSTGGAQDSSAPQHS
ncbi:hypothetical protein GOODEAATRI_021468 [Goodea atripinnis]|uniref:Uncharacterized protein n=1 Tax=Goodea atripinnis TaxID=208336 RepID=A0ABV0NFT2_9TELE